MVSFDCHSPNKPWYAKFRCNGKETRKGFAIKQDAFDFEQAERDMRHRDRKRKAAKTAEASAAKRQLYVKKNGSSNRLEAQGRKWLQEQVKDSKYKLVRVADCALYDLALCLRSDKEDDCKRLQVKTTATRDKHGVTHFHQVSGYKKGVLLCILMDEKKMWGIPGHVADTMASDLSIARRSKWNKYCVNDLIAYLDSVWTNKDYKLTMRSSLDVEGMSVNRLKLFKAHKLWLHATQAEVTLPFEENTPVSFLHNNKKVKQLCSQFYANGHTFSVRMQKNSGIVDGRATACPYEKGDFGVLSVLLVMYEVNGKWTFKSDSTAKRKLHGYWEFPMQVLVGHRVVCNGDLYGRKRIGLRLPKDVCVACDWPKQKKSTSDWTRAYYHVVE